MSSLPPGVTARDVAPDECSTCAKCLHEDVEFNGVSDTDMGVYTCAGTCTECQADMEGKGRKREPDGGIEDIEWEVDGNGCGHAERAEDDAAEREMETQRENDAYFTALDEKAEATAQEYLDGRD